LKSDDDLKRLNDEARERGLRAQDETATREMRSEVARLLKIHGLNLTEPFGSEPAAASDQPDIPARGKRGPRTTTPIELKEPPTFIHFVWDQSEPITLYPEQRRYIRVECDAESSYYNPTDPSKSRINVILAGDKLRLAGATPLRGGRMRLIVEAVSDADLGPAGAFRVELSRIGLPTLADERQCEIIARPPAMPSTRRVSLPPFDVRPVEGPDDPLWDQLGWPEDISKIASTAEMEQGLLVVHFNTAFPKFAARHHTFELRDPALAESYVNRYKIWLAVHSLLMFADQESAAHGPELPETDHNEEWERTERIRTATLAALFAARETTLVGTALSDD
jgi:hypothetical protein